MACSLVKPRLITMAMLSSEGVGPVPPPAPPPDAGAGLGGSNGEAKSVQDKSQCNQPMIYKYTNVVYNQFTTISQVYQCSILDNQPMIYK